MGPLQVPWTPFVKPELYEARKGRVRASTESIPLQILDSKNVGMTHLFESVLVALIKTKMFISFVFWNLFESKVVPLSCLKDFV